MTAKPHLSTQTPFNLRERAHTLLQSTDARLHLAKDASLALRVLFDLASSPDTVHDALALLHELQVHQVELDLQNEELQAARSELETAWARQIQLHDASPSAQVILDSAGHLTACNARALQCLNLHSQEGRGQRLLSCLDAVDRPRVQAWLDQAQQSDQPVALGFVLRLPKSPVQPVVAAARANPLAPGVLVSWVDAAPPL